uniref:Group 1 glycosyl transferase n=1 Tax=Aureimonas altamirensis TaxID=370622 RepID=A0A0P0YX37_9HYPH|nr:group 1 glycosyl transferase [Aureimonas altamirensis]
MLTGNVASDAENDAETEGQFLGWLSRKRGGRKSYGAARNRGRVAERRPGVVSHPGSGLQDMPNDLPPFMG